MALKNIKGQGRFFLINELLRLCDSQSISVSVHLQRMHTSLFNEALMRQSPEPNSHVKHCWRIFFKMNQNRLLITAFSTKYCSLKSKCQRSELKINMTCCTYLFLGTSFQEFCRNAWCLQNESNQFLPNIRDIRKLYHLLLASIAAIGYLIN